MELSIEEQTLVATYRNLDQSGREELLRHAFHQQKMQASSHGLSKESGQCKLDSCEPRPESVAEPIFTE